MERNPDALPLVIVSESDARDLVNESKKRFWKKVRQDEKKKKDGGTVNPHSANHIEPNPGALPLEDLEDNPWASSLGSATLVNKSHKKLKRSARRWLSKEKKEGGTGNPHSANHVACYLHLREQYKHVSQRMFEQALQDQQSHLDYLDNSEDPTLDEVEKNSWADLNGPIISVSDEDIKSAKLFLAKHKDDGGVGDPDNSEHVACYLMLQQKYECITPSQFQIALSAHLATITTKYWCDESGPEHQIPIEQHDGLPPTGTRGRLCSACGMLSRRHSCGHCGVNGPSYCSPDCQVHDWPNHRRECGADKIKDILKHSRLAFSLRVRRCICQFLWEAPKKRESIEEMSNLSKTLDSIPVILETTDERCTHAAIEAALRGGCIYPRGLVCIMRNTVSAKQHLTLLEKYDRLTAKYNDLVTNSVSAKLHLDLLEKYNNITAKYDDLQGSTLRKWRDCARDAIEGISKSAEKKLNDGSQGSGAGSSTDRQGNTKRKPEGNTKRTKRL